MDRELNSIPFERFRIFNFSSVRAIIGVPISYISSHLRINKLLNLIPLFQLVIFILIQLVKSCSIVPTCDNYIDLTYEFKLASI